MDRNHYLARREVSALLLAGAGVFGVTLFFAPPLLTVFILAGGALITVDLYGLQAL